MMYESKMAVAIKSYGRVLRESGDAVFLPFGCEYSLLLKNLNSVRAIVRIWIDGTDAVEGTTGLVVPPNQSVELERFIKNGNLQAGNRFKFIERSASVSAHRGNKIDDGLIRVEFEFEKVYAPAWPHNGPLFRSGIDNGFHYTYSSTDTRSFGSSSSVVGPNSAIASNTAEVGITVPGSESNQSFSTASWFPTDGVKHAMVLRLLGEVNGEAVSKPITVNHKPTCSTCGKLNRATSKFCANCGTSLNIVG